MRNMQDWALNYLHDNYVNTLVQIEMLHGQLFDDMNSWDMSRERKEYYYKVRIPRVLWRVLYLAFEDYKKIAAPKLGFRSRTRTYSNIQSTRGLDKGAGFPFCNPVSGRIAQ
jgi:hypothetical protein